MHTLRNLMILGLAAIIPSAEHANSVSADDWPQWMGPNRDNVWRETGIIDEFPATGLKTLWRTPLAGGYAGPAVSGGKVFVTDFQSWVLFFFFEITIANR